MREPQLQNKNIILFTKVVCACKLECQTEGRSRMTSSQNTLNLKQISIYTENLSAKNYPEYQYKNYSFKIYQITAQFFQKQNSTVFTVLFSHSQLFLLDFVDPSAKFLAQSIKLYHLCGSNLKVGANKLNQVFAITKFPDIYNRTHAIT